MKRLLIILLFFITLVITGCNPAAKQKDASLASDIMITEHPNPADFHHGSLDSLPSYNPNSEDGIIDLRGYDLSAIDLKDRYNDLMFSYFDNTTIWSQNLPDKFNPQKIMELGKNPGLGVDQLHEKGINGKGVGIAIIDSALLVDHIEYKDNLKMYEEIHCFVSNAGMHSSATASIAVGKTTGVAPGADLYFIGGLPGDYKNGTFVYDFTWDAKCIDRILEVNKTLPEGKKIRVISISLGWDKSQKGYDEITDAVNRAKKQGIFVVSSSLFDTYGYSFSGLGREPLKDPDTPLSYEPGLFWGDKYYKDSTRYNELWHLDSGKALLVPMDSRTTASPTGINDYVFYREGGWSWSIPYIAGLYALACQVKPDITPDIFWTKALETGDTIKVVNNGKEYEFKKVVNPVRLIDNIKRN